MRFVLCSLCGLCILTACQQDPLPQASPSHPAVASSPAAPPRDLGASRLKLFRAHCLDAPAEIHITAARLREAQSKTSAAPENPSLWTQTADTWFEMSRLNAQTQYLGQMEACLEVALSLNPNDLDAKHLRAVLLQSRHQFKAALEALTQILSAQPNHLGALGLLTDVALDLGDYEQALDAAQRLIDLRPSPLAYARASYVRFLHGDTDEAKDLIRTALMSGRNVKYPEPTAWVFCEAALLFWHTGDYTGADAVFSEALKWVPDYPAALLGRGRALLSLGRVSEAIPLLTKASAQLRTVEAAWLLGDAHAAAGDQAQAQAAYAQAHTWGEDDPLTRSLFLSTHAQDPALALALIEQERENRANIYVDDAHAWALYRLGNHAKAKEMAERATRLGTQDARILYHAGAILIAAGDPAKGRSLIEQALQLNPAFDLQGSREAKEILQHVLKN